MSMSAMSAVSMSMSAMSALDESVSEPHAASPSASSAGTARRRAIEVFIGGLLCVVREWMAEANSGHRWSTNTELCAEHCVDENVDAPVRQLQSSGGEVRRFGNEERFDDSTTGAE